MTNQRELSEQLTFEKGILESLEDTHIPKGFLQECLNWVPDEVGGLRCRPKWELGSTDGVPATRHCKGIGLFQRFTAPRIVQMSSVYTNTANLNGSTPITPTVVWGLPTLPGSTLVAVINGAYFQPTTLALTFTGDPWTPRLAIDGPQTQGVPFLGVYEFQSNSIFTGTVSPFTIDGSGASAAGFIQVRILELTGISGFDQLVENTTHVTGTPFTQDFGVTVTGAENAQASELMLAIGGSTVQSQSGGTAYQMDTATTGWSKYTETNAPWFIGSGAYPGAWAIWTKVAAAIETPTIVITENQTLNKNQADMDGVLLTYKGWNDAVDPAEGADTLLAADDNGATYDIYGIERESMDVDAWELLDAGIGDSTGGEPVSFAVGLGATYYTAPSFPGLRRYIGVAETVGSSPAGARSICFHRDRMWAASGSRVSWSQIGDGNTWPNSSDNTGSGYFDVNLDDGENVECVSPHAGFLVITKRTSAYVITGRNAEEFALEPLPGGDGAPGQSIVSTPYGCVIAGRRMVYILGSNSSALTINTNVLNVSPLGRPIEASYSVGSDEFVWCDYADGKVFVTVGSAGKTFVYNFETQAWHIEQVDEGTVEAPAITFSYDGTQYFGPVAATVGSLVNFRRYPHGSRGKDFDTLSMSFAMQTGDMSPAGVRMPITPRQCFVRVRQRTGTDAEAGLIVYPVFDGELGEACEVAAGNIGVRREVVAGFPQQSGVDTIGVRIEQDVPTDEGITFDLEDMFIDFTVEQPRA